jgi:hypothetical protein
MAAIWRYTARTTHTWGVDGGPTSGDARAQRLGRGDGTARRLSGG